MRVFNLAELARRLRAEGKHQRLSAIIESLNQRNSRLADLKHARELLSLLATVRSEKVVALGPQPPGSPIADIQGSLLAQAVTLYARAASPGDRGRARGPNVEKFLSEEQRATHRRVLDLRNSAIAHLDGEERQNWHRDGMLLVVREDGWTYGFSYSRTMYQAGLFGEFVALLDVLIPSIASSAEADNRTLHEALEDAIRADPQVRAILDRCEFDSDSFYGVGSAAGELWQAIHDGAEELIQNVSYSAEC